MTEEQQPIPHFEIDRPESFAQFLLDNPREILFYLRLLAQRRCLLTAYLDAGQHFFLTAIIAIDEASGQFFLDPSNLAQNNADAVAARKVTLLTHLDHVKIQLRLTALRPGVYHGQPILAAALPARLLRLQRREFFRLEPPVTAPILCQVAVMASDEQTYHLDLTLSDISGGGACLVTAADNAPLFPRNALFQHCRLEIPGEGVIQVNLRVRKVFEFSAHDGQSHLRIGCEFVNLPSTRLAFIERYIARIERERKARTSGLPI
ncbi:MAG: flagellar brake protein [Betaproteobacteria bacterium]|nr:flagellar brake protein [Betaproteobacteria bacterium]MCL2885340.1 flagellar brake protein [Betaproteobacteria bacterium]